ncbi:hypothetical protein KY325_05150 [Candidatus Woesearchaeota archaeon]|nr:hypothetical protein [Candidatus Woesearchaeota archaeon]MBW3018521.1 hypothetical protein [Candidatus Woesearchaeota archaeon]
MEYDQEDFEEDDYEEKLADDEIDGAEEGFIRGYDETVDKDERGQEEEEDFDFDDEE